MTPPGAFGAQSWTGSGTAAIGKDELQFLPRLQYVGYKGRRNRGDLALGCGAVNAIRHILSWLVLGLAVQAHAGASGTDPAGAAAPAGGLDAIMKGSRSSGDNFLPVDEAFRFDAVAAVGDLPVEAHRVAAGGDRVKSERLIHGQEVVPR